jgi:arylsulfatase A-like enzyme
MSTTVTRLMLSGLVASLALAPGAETRPPNVLVMLADDLGYADAGFQGCTDVPTPNLDALAAGGVRFSSGYVSAPVCSPSRAGLITGRYQTRFGHEFNHPLADRAPVGLPVQEKTFADHLKAGGYATGHIGKWHLGNSKMPEFNPRSRGFLTDIWFPGQTKLPPLPFFRDGKPETADDPYVDTAMAREAAGFIHHHQSQPWFLYVAFLTPHEPLDIPGGADAPFTGITDPARRKCAAMLTLLDTSVGTVMAALRASGQEGRTLVAFLGDNGAPPKNGSRNTPLKGGKGATWEGGIREPFVMQWKGTIPAGKTVDAPVISLDLLPTALAAAKITPIAGTELDGRNLLPYLTGKTTTPPHEALFWRYGEKMAIRKGDWKLVRSPEKNAPKILKTGLYDLSKDIAEAEDLSAANPAKVAELQAQWDQWNRTNVTALWTSTSNEDRPGKGE